MSRCVAATTRTSIFCDLLSPTGRISLSWSTRRSLACSGSAISPISSRRIVPPSATAKRPLCALVAPVKAPLAWPKSSLSMRFSGIDAQFMGTNALSRRELARCSAWAISSLPVPVSPVMSTEQSVSATRRTMSNTRSSCGSSPTISGQTRSRHAATSPPLAGGMAASERVLSARRSASSRASRENGLVRKSSAPWRSAVMAWSRTVCPVITMTVAGAPRCGS